MIELVQLADIFKALSNPHRLAIFQRLSRCCVPGTRCDVEFAKSSVGEIGEGLDIAPSTLSHHLKTLSQCGLIKTSRRGQFVDCCVDPDILNQLGRYFSEPLAPACEEKTS